MIIILIVVRFLIEIQCPSKLFWITKKPNGSNSEEESDKDGQREMTKRKETIKTMISLLLSKV